MRKPLDVQQALAELEQLAAQHTPRPPKAKTVRIRTGGYTQTDYQTMLAQQDGRCAICRVEPPNGERLHIDHDHTLGHVRGLLCQHCNLGLGHFRDNTQLLDAAVTYLHRTTLQHFANPCPKCQRPTIPHNLEGPRGQHQTSSHHCPYCNTEWDTTWTPNGQTRPNPRISHLL